MPAAQRVWRSRPPRLYHPLPFPWACRPAPATTCSPGPGGDEAYGGAGSGACGRDEVASSHTPRPRERSPCSPCSPAPAQRTRSARLAALLQPERPSPAPAVPLPCRGPPACSLCAAAAPAFHLACSPDALFPASMPARQYAPLGPHAAGCVRVHCRRNRRTEKCSLLMVEPY